MAENGPASRGGKGGGPWRPKTAFRAAPKSDTLSVSFLDDGGDSWWAGSQQCFARVAIAGAAALLSANVAIANGFNAQDETPTPVTGGDVNGSNAGQRFQYQTTYLRWAQVDELPASAPTATLEEPDWSPPRVPDAVMRAIWGGEDEVLAPVILPEEDVWQPVLVQAQPLVRALWGGEDETPTVAPTLSFEEDAAPVAAPGYAIPLRVIWGGEDERPTPETTLPAEEEFAIPPTPPAQFNYIVWATDEDAIPAPGTLSVDEHDWQPPTPIWPAAFRFTPAQQDERPAPAAWFEDDSWAAGPRVGAFSFLQWWDSDEALTTASAAAFEEDTAPLAYAPLAAVRASLWGGEDELPALFASEEDAVLTPAPQLPSARLTLWGGEDELPVQIATLAFEEDAPGLFRPALSGLAAQPAQDFEDYSTPIGEEPEWRPALTALCPPVISAFADEESLPTPAPAVPEEEYNLLPQLSVPLAPPALRVWTEQDEWPTPPPLTVSFDEEYVLTFPTPPAPFVLATGTTLPVEEDFPELSTPVPPVSDARSGPNRLALIAYYEAQYQLQCERRAAELAKLRAEQAKLKPPRAPVTHRVARVCVTRPAPSAQQIQLQQWAQESYLRRQNAGRVLDLMKVVEDAVRSLPTERIKVTDYAAQKAAAERKKRQRRDEEMVIIAILQHYYK